LLFALFLCCATPYRITTGSVSIGLSEIAALVYILWRWIAGGEDGPKPDPAVRWLLRGIWGLAVWAGFLWMLSANWETRQEMVFDWILAGLVLASLLRSPIKDGRRLALVFVLAALPNVFLGALQHGMGIGLAPKDFFGWSADARSFPVYGYFGHSNDLAVYLYWPLLACFGLAASSRAWSRAIFALLSIVFCTVLFWTLSRSTLIALGTVGGVSALFFLLRRRKTFLAVLGAAALAAVLFLIWIFLAFPIGAINPILSGRLKLWGTAWQVISADPLFLPLGYLAQPPPGLRVFWIPHSIYLLSWLEFGWPGVMLLAGLAWFFLWNGWKRYDRLRIHPAAAILWVGMAGLFLVNGPFILYFHETYVILNFICVTAVWIAQLRAVDLPAPASG
jgi:O-antigen ligase